MKMTVLDLVHKLGQFDPNLPVVAYLYDPQGTTEHAREITDVQPGKSNYEGLSNYVAILVRLE